MGRRSARIGFMCNRKTPASGPTTRRGTGRHAPETSAEAKIRHFGHFRKRVWQMPYLTVRAGKQDMKNQIDSSPDDPVRDAPAMPESAVTYIQ
jgi:hypothetical protein